MPKRKSDCGGSGISLTSFDAAVDLLVCESFTRLHQLAAKFESAAGIKLNDGVVASRWEEGVKRYWVMRSMDDLCCAASKPSTSTTTPGEVKMEDTSERSAGENSGQRRDSGGRLLPATVHPGAPAVHGLNIEEEQEWRRWNPRAGDAVLVELSDDSLWPGKVIEKKIFFQGRVQPRGNHFYVVRLYNDQMQPTISVKSRMIPLHLRPNPPLLASTPILSAFNHAARPTTFDLQASARESLDAHHRTHPGVGKEPDRAKLKADKSAWNELVNWVMSERRVEKMRAIEEERLKRLQEVSKDDTVFQAPCDDEDSHCKKRRTSSATDPYIIGPTPAKATTASFASFIRPALGAPQRPDSPSRRLADRRRSMYTNGERSPRRGGTYTPPRILPSGDETAPQSTGSPVPQLKKFDFVSPLGPVRLGRLDSGPPALQRKSSLEAVKEEPTEDDGWTLVQNKRSRRAGSAPCRDKAEEMGDSQAGPSANGQSEMSVDG